MEDQAISSSNDQTQVAPPVPSTQTPAPTFVGNFNDVLAIVAATLAGVTAFGCLTMFYGLYCLPGITLIIGAVALVNAKASVQPDRTKRWGWISLGTGGVFLVIMVALIFLFVLFYIAMFAIAFSNMDLPSRRY
ncbi:MAG: hypothetical protein HZB51_15025 [Chloroflexi bacterium]|nr:hypothetical protein [Chloroflexota bacterium]